MRTTNYLYIARSKSDPNAKKHSVYKVGHSSRPLDRIRTLAGSASTETYEPILILALPAYVKDVHILSHRSIQRFVVHQHVVLQSKYIDIFGAGHADGIKRRREIVMFGLRYAVSKMKDLFRRVVGSITSRTGAYMCKDSECIVNDGTSSCSVCSKFTQSLFNCITYQKRLQQSCHKRTRVIEAAETRLVSMLTHKHNRKKWDGPTVGSFWIMRPDVSMRRLGYRYLIVRIISNNKRTRISSVQEWSHSGTDQASLVNTLQSRFTTDNIYSNVHWDQASWQCVVYMRRFRSFCRLLNVSDVMYIAQQWPSSG